MAISSKCPNQNCKKTSFELKTESVENSKYKFSFIRCRSCGTVVGTTEAHYVSELVVKLAKSLDKDILK